MWIALRRSRCSTTAASVGGVVVHVVTVADLARAAMAAPVVGDDAVALAEEVEHLGVPVVGASAASRDGTRSAGRLGPSPCRRSPCRLGRDRAHLVLLSLDERHRGLGPGETHRRHGRFRNAGPGLPVVAGEFVRVAEAEVAAVVRDPVDGLVSPVDGHRSRPGRPPLRGTPRWSAACRAARRRALGRQRRHGPAGTGRMTERLPIAARIARTISRNVGQSGPTASTVTLLQRPPSRRHEPGQVVDVDGPYPVITVDRRWRRPAGGAAATRCC